MVARMLLYNDSFAWIHRDSFTDKVIELVPIVTESYKLVTPEGYPELIYIDFTLKDGNRKVLPLDQVLHFVGDFSSNEFFGDNNNPLIEVTNINSDLWHNLVVWTKDNTTVKGFLKTDSILKKDDMESAKKEFSDLLKSNDSAYMTLDGKFDYIPVNDKSSPMDVNYIDKIESSISKFFHISPEVLNGTATTEQMETFHKICLEPIYSMIEAEFEAKFLTQHEVQGYNHRICFVCNNFEHITPSEKTSAFTLLTNVGVITGNELREAYGFERVAELDTIMYSKNFAELGKTDETGNNKNVENNVDNSEEVNNQNEEEGI